MQTAKLICPVVGDLTLVRPPEQVEQVAAVVAVADMGLM
tara:strand:+ start:104 stop:220 length:117 start_codon:yes stop_codon:yes gene_type:complete